jgi:hypothetical protein
VTRALRVVLLVWLASAAGAAVVSAQGIYQPPALPDPEQAGRFRLGFIRYTPSINIANVGVDTNVFNELEDPKDDFTASFGPKAEFWSRLGSRARVYGSTGVDYQYFHEYDSQRSFGTSNIARLELDFGRFIPFAEGNYTNTRVRPGFEIDERSRREAYGGRAGLSVRVMSKTTLVGWAGQGTYRFDSSEGFDAEDLSYALDRDSKAFGAGVEVALTPLTTLIVDAESGEDRFRSSPGRDADSTKVRGGFKFKPMALIDGTVLVGVRSFETLSPLVPNFDGVIAVVDLGYTVRSTRFSGQYNRDITYSYENIEPYYLQTDWELTVVQKITSSIDVVGRGGLYRLDYERIGLSDNVRRSDSGVRYGGGIGYLLGEFVRVGFDVNYIDRESEADITRNYEGVRAGVSMTYGIKRR